MAVAVVTAGTDVFTAGATSLTTGSFTVGAGVTALLAVITIGASGGGAGPTGVSCAWNTSSPMAQIVGPVPISGVFITSGTTYFFWIANPAQVTSTATVSWTNSCRACLGLISFSGTDTTTPFLNSTSNTGVGGTATLGVSIPANGAAVAMGMDCSNFSSGMTGAGITSWFFDTNAIQTATGYGGGIGASGTLTFNVPDSAAPNGVWSMAGVAVQPSLFAPPCGQIWC